MINKRNRKLLKKLKGFPKVFFKNDESGVRSYSIAWTPNKYPYYAYTYYNYKK